jgi:hypothetical protein
VRAPRAWEGAWQQWLLVAVLTCSAMSAGAQVVEDVVPSRGGGARGAAPAPSAAPGAAANRGVPVLDFGGRSMTRKAPEGSEPPSNDPRNFAGVWSVSGTSNSVLYELKPELVGKLASPANSSFSVPNIGSRQCHPTAYFGQMISVYPIQIIQTPTQINFVYEENRRVRRIYIGGTLPTNPTPAYFGHSVAHWDGDVLVVETVGTKGLIDFMQVDKPAVRIVERLHKVENNTMLQSDVTYYNDAEWAKPGTFSLRYNWRPDMNVMELICEEFSDRFGRGYDSLR